MKYFFRNSSMHLKRTQTSYQRSTFKHTFKHTFSKTPETHNMSSFQQSALINFFNTSLVNALANKYGFDADDALIYINDISPMSTKVKKVKDPNAPKRSPTAFFLFSKHYRTENADDIAGKKASDVAKLAGAAWSEIKETDAAEPFRTKAAELKASFALERPTSDRGSSPEPKHEKPAPVLEAAPAPVLEAAPAPVLEAAPAPKKVSPVKKAKAPKKVKPSVPAFDLPFLGAIAGCCHAIKNNKGLYTQCTKVPAKECGDFCKTCFAQTEKNDSGLPNCGTIAGRDQPTWSDPKGKQPVSYITFLKKSKDDNLKAIIADHSVAETEATRFGWTIPADQWVSAIRTKAGRPRTNRSAVVTSDEGSDTDSIVAPADLIQKLVAESKITAADATPEEYEPETDDGAPIVVTPEAQSDVYDVETDDEGPPHAEVSKIDVKEYTLGGIKYLLDKDKDEIYCAITHEAIGILMTSSDGEPYIEYYDPESDAESDEE